MLRACRSSNGGRGGATTFYWRLLAYTGVYWSGQTRYWGLLASTGGRWGLPPVDSHRSSPPPRSPTGNKVASLRQRDMASRSGRRYAGRQNLSGVTVISSYWSCQTIYWRLLASTGVYWRLLGPPAPMAKPSGEPRGPSERPLAMVSRVDEYIIHNKL